MGRGIREKVMGYSLWYMLIFCHRRDAYALQNEEGGYRAVREVVTTELIEAHLLGELTAGWYALDEENTVRWAALDADEAEGLQQLQRAGLVLEDWGWPSYLEDSRRGGHLWIFFPSTAPVGARAVRLVLDHLLKTLDLTDRVERFPKQDTLTEEGLGNLMRGPLGVHRACGERFGFLDPRTLEPVGGNLSEQLQYMTGFRTVSGAQVADALARILEEERRTRRTSREGRKRRSLDREPIEALKEEMGPVYDFVSQYVELDEKGRGHCPFHPPDEKCSFAVNREEDYWVDFHDHSGGDAIAFYQRLKGVGFLEAFRQLAHKYGREDLIEALKT